MAGAKRAVWRQEGRAGRDALPRLLRSKWRFRRNAVACVARAVRDGGTVSAEGVDVLLVAVGRSNRRWREREAAAWALGNAPLTPEQSAKAVVALASAAILAKDDEGWPGGVSIHFVRLATAAATMSAALTISQIGKIPSLQDAAAFFAFGLVISAFFAVIAVLPVSYVIETDRLRAVRAAAVRALGRFGASSSLPIVVRAVAERGTRVRTAALDVLPRILDGIEETTSTPGFLESESGASAAARATAAGILRSCAEGLYALLYSGREPLVISILRALGRVGDGSAVQPVERLVKRGRTEAVRRLAEEVLPVLQERLRAEQAPHVLLRAAEAPASDPGELLRPASAQAEVDPGTLLRPASTDAFR